MNTWLNQGRLRRPGRGLKKWEKLVESKSTNRLEHKNPDTPLVTNATVIRLAAGERLSSA